jgi:hypothetical protein
MERTDCSRHGEICGTDESFRASTCCLVVCSEMVLGYLTTTAAEACVVVIWVTTPSSLVGGYQCFGETCCIIFSVQGRNDLLLRCLYPLTSQQCRVNHMKPVKQSTGKVKR